MIWRTEMVALLAVLAACTSPEGDPAGSQRVCAATIPRDEAGCFMAPFDHHDLDPERMGIQPDCSVADVTNLGMPNQVADPIRRCVEAEDHGMAVVGVWQDYPCWWIEEVASCDVTGLRLQVDRADPAPDGMVLVSRCITEPCSESAP